MIKLEGNLVKVNNLKRGEIFISIFSLFRKLDRAEVYDICARGTKTRGRNEWSLERCNSVVRKDPKVSGRILWNLLIRVSNYTPLIFIK